MLCHQLRSIQRDRAVKWKVLAVSIVLTARNTCSGGIVLFNDFERFSSSAGSLSVSDDSARTIFTQMEVPNDLADTSLRTQLRVTHGFVGAIVRWDPRQPAPNGYYAVIRHDGTAQLGWAGGSWPVLREVATGLDPTSKDIVLQVDAIDNRIHVWTWADGDLFPANPTLSLIDDTLVGGTVGLGGMSLEFPERGPVEAMFRYVHVADTHIPEPAAAILAAYAFVAMIFGRGCAHPASARL